ncbi:MAG TPA: CpsD/CapB family tyrosine-protein kinase [Streptosporangiaceae bacterium]|jgi:Mrp family chromosome partitioning ATPase/capsular polysaccharide biosynthesis protein
MPRQVPEQEDFAAEPRSIDLRDYWLVVRRRWVLVVVVTLIGGLGGAAYAYNAAPSYAATSQVVVTAEGPLGQSTQASQQQVNMSTEQAIAQSAPVITQAAQYLGVQPAVLQTTAAKRLTVTVPASTLTTSNVLQIAWKASSPRLAQAGANAFAKAYLSFRHSQLAGQLATLEGTLKAQVASLRAQIGQVAGQLSRSSATSSAHQTLTIRLNELTSQAGVADTQLATLATYDDSGGKPIYAAIPTKPSGLGHSTLLALGLLIGLLIGLILAFARDVFDDRVRDVAQLERRLGAATLAVLPPAEHVSVVGRNGVKRQAPAIATAESPNSRAADAVRVLRATVVAAAARGNLHTFLVVSTDAGVSSGRVAAELGVALAESGRRVLLVASDVRGSVLPQIFDVPNNNGLTDLLAGGGDPEVVTHHPKQASGTPLPATIVKRLAVLPSGHQLANTLSIVHSSGIRDLLQSQRVNYDFVLLDAPPATVSDAFALGSHVDGVIVLASEARTRGRAVEGVRHSLDQVGAVVIGGVFVGRSKVGRHRQQRSPEQSPVISPAPASTDRTGSAQAARPAPPVTRPFPAVPGGTPSGGPAKRSS